MQITDVRIRLVPLVGDGRLKAVASVTIDDCFVVHDMKIIAGADGLFVSMPSRKSSDGTYKDIAHAINNETREYLIGSIMAAYKEELAKAEQK